MTDTNDTPGADTPDASSTQGIPSPATQALPTSGGYSYPGEVPPSPVGSPQPPPSAAPTAAAPASFGTDAGVPLSEDPPAGNPKRTGLLIGGLAAAVVLGGGGVFAANLLSGGGARPSDVLPGDSYAYFQLDIDPSAGQKIAAVRFLDKLPQVKDNFSGEDMRKKLWDGIAKDDDCLGKLSYDSDIAPWLGDRVGMSLRPGGTQDVPNLAIALQVKDDGQAQRALTTLFDCGSEAKTDLRMKDGYAIVTPGGNGDATIAAVDQGTLSDSANFSSDMSALGEQGVASAWFDTEPALKDVINLVGSRLDGQQVPTDAKGRVAMALRFDASFVELAGVARGVEGIKASDTNGIELASLPVDTAAAVQVSGADKLIDAAWPQLVKLSDEEAKSSGEDPINAIEEGFDVSLPDDLKLLFGSSLTIALPDQMLGDDAPIFGAKVLTPDSRRAGNILTKIQDASDGEVTFSKKVDGDKLAVATNPDYTDALLAGGKLGDSDGFKAALGDLSKTNLAIYVDLDMLEKQYLSDVPADQRDFVEALKAVGLNSSTTADGEQTFSLRLVGN